KKISAPLSIDDLLLSCFGSLRLLRGVLLQPTHHSAKVSADFFHLVLLFRFAQRVELLYAGLVFVDPLARKLAALDFRKNLLHRGASFVADNSRSARQIAIFGGV